MRLADYRNRWPRAVAVLFLLAVICYYSGGAAAEFGIPITAGAAVLLILFSRRRSPHRISQPSGAAVTEQLLPLLAQKDVAGSIARVQVSALGVAFRKEQREKTEATVDTVLDACIKLVHMRINAHTIAVFFPGADGGYRLRRYWSQSSHLHTDAMIRPGQGVLGGFFKDGLKTLNLQEIISDSATLFYYSSDAGVRSLIVCPIAAGGVDRGFILADSTEKRAFTDEHLSFLSIVAAVAGQAAYHSYLSTEHSLELMRLAEVSNIEKEFFRHLTVGSILDTIAQIVPFALPCDRMTISLRSDDGETAVITHVHGVYTAGLLETKFSLLEKSLASILYSKNLSLSRNFAGDRYEVRYCEKEPHEEDFASFCAVPLGVDECKGMILLESLHPDAFPDALCTLLSRIATSAGLAMEKVLLIEKAHALATHDGLTGLFNHRQFQQLLRDEVIRSGRYNDPLALVIGDLDLFKKTNDTYGHPFGDMVLKNVASILETSVRAGIDTAARYGGEEFALILVKTDEQQANETVDRIRTAIERSIVRSPAGEDIHVTMSFGIALLGKHARDPDDLIKKADKALYRAKGHGRNRVEIF